MDLAMIGFASEATATVTKDKTSAILFCNVIKTSLQCYIKHQ